MKAAKGGEIAVTEKTVAEIAVAEMAVTEIAVAERTVTEIAVAERTGISGQKKSENIVVPGRIYLQSDITEVLPFPGRSQLSALLPLLRRKPGSSCGSWSYHPQTHIPEAYLWGC